MCRQAEYYFKHTIMHHHSGAFPEFSRSDCTSRTKMRKVSNGRQPTPGYGSFSVAADHKSSGSPRLSEG